MATMCVKHVSVAPTRGKYPTEPRRERKAQAESRRTGKSDFPNRTEPKRLIFRKVRNFTRGAAGRPARWTTIFLQLFITHRRTTTMLNTIYTKSFRNAIGIGVTPLQEHFEAIMREGSYIKGGVRVG